MMTYWVWGQVPAAFEPIRQGEWLMLVHSAVRAFPFAAACLNGGSAQRRASSFRGRAALESLVLSNGERALVRPYCHGGLLRHVTGRVFWSWPPRPFQELSVTEKVRQRGVRTAVIYAACVQRLAGPFYRGWLISREIEGARDLWTILEREPVDGEIKPLLRAAAAALESLHRAGVYHADLNLKNILVAGPETDPEVYFIDFDKARLFNRPVPSRLAKASLERLYRSWRKLGRCAEREWKWFCEACTAPPVFGKHEV